MRMMRIVAMVPLLIPPLAAADPIFFGDGGTRDVQTSTNAAYVVQDGTLDILPGAGVLSVSTDGDGASIRMSGGQVTAGISASRGSLDISGGQARGFDNPAYGGDGVEISQATARITGGTFTGGDSGGQAGSGVVGSAGTANGTPFVSTLSIGGGTFVGGAGSGGHYGGDTGYSLLSIGNTTVTGGHFLSPIAINTAYGGETDFLGTGLTYRDHLLTGVLQDGDPIAVRIYSNTGDVTVNDSGTEVRFLPTSPDDPNSGPVPDPPGPVPDSPSPVPEPASALIFVLLAGLGLAQRRSHRGR